MRRRAVAINLIVARAGSAALHPAVCRPAELFTRSCRIADVAYARAYAQMCMAFHVQPARLRRSRNCWATLSCRRIEPDRRFGRLAARPITWATAHRLSILCMPLASLGVCFRVMSRAATCLRAGRVRELRGGGGCITGVVSRCGTAMGGPGLTVPRGGLRLW